LFAKTEPLSLTEGDSDRDSDRDRDGDGDGERRRQLRQLRQKAALEAAFIALTCWLF